MSNSISNKVLQARREADISQERVANAIGITLRTYTKKEKGESEFKASELKAIAEETKKPIQWFFEEE